MKFTRLGRWLALSMAVAGVVHPAAAGENYAFLVAVSDYDEKELRPLKFTRNDILDFHAALVESGFKPEHIVLMHDDFKQLVAYYDALDRRLKPQDYLPEAAKIRQELELLLGRLRSDDSVVVAFTGHGVQFQSDRQSYFCPSDARLDQPESLIAFDAIYRQLKECRASRRLLLVDACQNDPQSEIAKSRSTVDLESITRPQSLPVPEGIIALFSCRAGQKSFEHPSLGHGIFFHHLLEGWRGSGDLNGDGRISYQELASYTEKQTSDYAALTLKALQTPQLKAEFSGEWVLRDLKSLLVAPFDINAARSAQANWAKQLRRSPVERNSIGLELVLVPPGEYRQGSTPEETAGVLRRWPDTVAPWVSNEGPQHRVRITRPLYFGKTEVTKAQWRAVMNTTPWTDKGGADTPANAMTWHDAQEFCRRLSEREARRYRLPTESEWEYACRAGTGSRYSFGDDPARLAEYAWFQGNSAIGGTPGVHPVAQKKPNAFGLFDMHGNVWEWCAEYADHSFYHRSTTDDPPGPSTGTIRSARGAGWGHLPQYMRSASRSGFAPGSKFGDLGFRVVAETGNQ